MRGPAYRIDCERLRLRCWDPADAPLLANAIDESLAHLRQTLNFARDEPIELDARIEKLRRYRADFDSGGDRVYAVVSLDETRVLGGAGLHARVGREALEIGYWVHADFLRRGYATEIAAALTRVGFELHGVRRMEIHVDPDNVPSARVAEKLGYQHEATLEERFPPLDGGWRDAMIWTLFARDFPASPAAQANITVHDAAGRRIDTSASG